jgi:hypothetical protein
MRGRDARRGLIDRFARNDQSPQFAGVSFVKSGDFCLTSVGARKKIA